MSGTQQPQFVTVPLDDDNNSVSWLDTLKAIPRAATRLPVGLVSSLLSAPNAQGVEKFIPSAATGAYSFLNDAQKFVGHLIGTPELELPGAQRAAELTAAASGPQSISNLIPHASPQNEVERVLGDAAQSAGQMGPLLPESALGVVPGAARIAAETLLPGIASKAAPIIAGGATAAADVLAPTPANATQEQQSVAGSPQMVTVPLEDQQPDNALPVPPIPPTSPSQQVTRVTSPSAQPQTVSVPMEVTIPFDAMNHPDTSVTWGDVALYGGGLLAVMVGGPRMLKFVEDLSGNTRAARYRAASGPFNAQQADIAAGRVPVNDTRVEAPLPGVAGDGLTGAAEAVQDRNARINAYTNAAASSPTVARQLRAQTGITNNDLAFDARLQHMATTGEDNVTGIRMPSPVDHWAKLAELSDDQRELYDQARYAANELDNRVNNQRSGMAQGAVPPPGQIRVNFPGYDDAQLRAYVSSARADPQVSALLDEINRISEVKMDIAEARGMLNAGDKARILRDHPNYLADADINGIIENPFAARELSPSSGFESALHPSWELDKQHLETFYKAIEQNDLRRNIVQTALDYQQRDPQVAQIFRESKDSAGNWVAGKDTIPVRINGELRYYHIASPALRAAIDQSPTASGALIGALNSLRNLSQSSITGTAAMVAGHFFAPINAIRSAVEGSIIRPSGSAGGYLDKALQSISGGRLGLPGDPTAVFTMPREWLAGAGAEGAKALASILDPQATNSANRALRSMFGNSVIDAMHTRVQAAWANSIRAEMQRSGAMNAAGMSSTPIPSQQLGASENVFSPLNNLVPQLFRVNGPLGSAMPHFVRLNNLANEVKSIVGEAANQQFYRLNRQLTPEQRTFETRQLTGDPGTRGKSGAVRQYNAISDYANIALQDVSRVVRAFKEQPATTVLGLMTALGTGAMAEVFSAMLHGPDAIQHLNDETSNLDSSSNVRIYIPGQPPEAALKIPLNQSIRVFYPMMRQAIADVLSLQAHPGNPGVAQWAMDGMRDFFAKHITQSTVDESVAGLSSAVSPPLPTPVAPLVAMVGKTINPTLDAAYQNAGQFPNIPAMFSHDLTSQTSAPNQMAGADSLTGSVGGNVFKQAVTSALGFVGQAISSALDTYESAQRATGDSMYALGNVVQDYKGRVEESLPFLNGVVWNHEDRLSTQTPLMTRVHQSLDAIRPLASWKTDAKWQGLTRARGVELPQVPGQPNKLPTDPRMLNMYITAGQYASIIDSKMMPQITDIRKQMNALSHSPLSPQAVQGLRNQYTREMQQKYEDVAGLINDLNDQLSQMAGKRVTATSINWGGDFSQFSHQANPQQQ